MQVPCMWLTSSKEHENSTSQGAKANCRNTPLYSAPSRKSSLSGKTLAQGTSSFWMSRPNRKGWEGRVRPSRGWQVGEKKSIPAWSLLPRKVLVNVTLSSSSKNFPVTEYNDSVVKLFFLSQNKDTLINGSVDLHPTFLGFLVNIEIEWEDVFRKSFFFWQTFQQKHQLFLTQSLKPVRAKTPALSTAVWTTKQKHKEFRWESMQYFFVLFFYIFIQYKYCVCWDILHSTHR